MTRDEFKKHPICLDACDNALEYIAALPALLDVVEAAGELARTTPCRGDLRDTCECLVCHLDRALCALESP